MFYCYECDGAIDTPVWKSRCVACVVKKLKANLNENEELRKHLAEAESKIPKWIPVDERLPKPGANILAIDNSGDMGVCNFVNAKFIGECFGFEAYLNDGGWDCSASKVIGEYVTHWMPLPGAPKQEETE